MIDDDAYVVAAVEQGVAVVRLDSQSDETEIVLHCHDRSNAEHYALLLNKAYRVGYRAGLRQARSAAS